MNATLQGMDGALAKITDMTSFQGAAAESVKAYLREVHPLCKCTLQGAAAELQGKYLLYRKWYQDHVDYHLHAVIASETLNECQQTAINNVRNLQSIEGEIQAELAKISHIYAGYRPSAGNYEYNYEKLTRDIKEIKLSAGRLHGKSNLRTTVSECDFHSEFSGNESE